MLASMMEHVRSQAPLIDCITNIVTVESMANALLAVGASPCMADVPEEMAEFVAISDAVLCNIGGMSDQNVTAMQIATREATARDIPLVMDPVGLGASRRRSDVCQSLLARGRFAAIRGNISEMRALAGVGGATRGVDAAVGDRMDIALVVRFAAELARRHHTVIAISGAEDILSDGSHSVCLIGGDPMMARITGSGCMSGAVLAAFIAANRDTPFEAAVAAAALMKAAGHRAAETVRAQGLGLGHFHTYFLDALSLLTPEEVAARTRIESLNQFHES